MQSFSNLISALSSGTGTMLPTGYSGAMLSTLSFAGAGMGNAKGSPSPISGEARDHDVIEKSDVPKLFHDAFGIASIEYNLFNVPTLSPLLFILDKKGNLTLDAFLKEYEPDKTHIINGHKFRPVQKSFVESPLEGQMALSVNYESTLDGREVDAPLDRQVKMKKLLEDPKELRKRKEKKKKLSYTLGALAGQAGVPLRGKTDIPIKVDRDIDRESTTTLRSHLKDETFAFYEVFPRMDRSEILLYDWNLALPHVIELDEVVDGYNALPPVNYNGQGTVVDGVPLLFEVFNGEIVLEDGADEGEEDGDIHEWHKSGDVDYNIWPLGDEVNMKSMTTIWDNGGPMKQLRQLYTINGRPVEEQIWDWGFQYTSGDAYKYRLKGFSPNQNAEISFTGINRMMAWREVKWKIKKYNYDKDGYLVSVVTRTSFMQRVLKESDSLEIISARAELALIGHVNSIDKDYRSQNAVFNRTMYSFGRKYHLQSAEYGSRWSNTPIEDQRNLSGSFKYNPNQIDWVVENRYLKSFSEVYPDRRSHDNDGIPQKFVSSRTIHTLGGKAIKDPRATRKGQKKEEIQFGEISTQKEWITILSKKRPEAYQTNIMVDTAKGEGLRETAKQHTFEQVSGRPPQAEMLIMYGEKAKEQKDEELYDIRHYFSTGSLKSTDKYGPTMSVTFNGVKDIEKDAEKAIQHWLKIKNIDAKTTTLKLHYARPEFRVGDLVRFNEKNWRIKSITNVQELKLRPRQESFTVTLGWDCPAIPVDILTVKKLKSE